MILDPNKLIQIGIGELAVSGGDHMISTVLGSCVSVCIYSPTKNIGGMNHYALARGSGEMNEVVRPYHYGEDAIPALVDEIVRQTSDRASTFLAKVAGGASGLTGTSGKVGQHNIEIAESVLQKYGIQIVGQHVGGNLGRKVIFYPSSGRLLVSLLEERQAG